MKNTAIALLIFSQVLFSCTKQLSSPVIPIIVVENNGGSKAILDAFPTTRWESGDCISVFFQGNENNVQGVKYKFEGSTGETDGVFKTNETDFLSAGQTLYDVFMIYPYSSNDKIEKDNGDIVVSTSLPSVQPYNYYSSGGSSPMMLANSLYFSDDYDSETISAKFSPICGILRLNVYGGDIIKSIKIEGNNHEKISGEARILIENAGQFNSVVNKLAIDQTKGLSTITITCGDDGFQTSKDIENPSIFDIILPEITFENGFTLTLTNKSGVSIVKQTTKKISVSQSTIQPINPFYINSSNGTSFLSFKAIIDGKEYESYDCEGKYITIPVPKGTELSKVKVAYESNGCKVEAIVDNTDVDASDKDRTYDFSSSLHKITFKVTASDGSFEEHPVMIYDTDLPVVYVTSKAHCQITDRTNWEEMDKCFILSYNEFGDPEITELLSSTDKSYVKGRGNMSWSIGDVDSKHGYNIKLGSSTPIFGMPAGRRWSLCPCNHHDGYFYNPFMFELARQLDHLGWNPHASYCEYILNGEYFGLYRMTEKIQISKNRMNLMDLGDLDGDQISGGYIFTYCSTFDGDYKFRSNIYNYPISFKDPDEDITQAQFDYVKDYIDSLESALTDTQRRNNGDYLEYLDIDSFVDALIIYEIACLSDSRIPGSMYYHKDQNGKLKAGPVWDLGQMRVVDRKNFGSPFFCGPGAPASNNKCKPVIYYGELLQDTTFANTLKDRMNELDWDSITTHMFDYLDNLASQVQYGSLRDVAIFDNIGKSDKEKTNIWTFYTTNLAILKENVNNNLPISINKDNYYYEW